MTIQITPKAHKHLQTVIYNVLSVRLSEDEQYVVVITKDETPQSFSRAVWDFEKRVSIWEPINPDKLEKHASAEQ